MIACDLICINKTNPFVLGYEYVCTYTVSLPLLFGHSAALATGIHCGLKITHESSDFLTDAGTRCHMTEDCNIDTEFPLQSPDLREQDSTELCLCTFYTVHYRKLLKKWPTNAPISLSCIRIYMFRSSHSTIIRVLDIERVQQATIQYIGSIYSFQNVLSNSKIIVLYVKN